MLLQGYFEHSYAIEVENNKDKPYAHLKSTLNSTAVDMITKFPISVYNA